MVKRNLVAVTGILLLTGCTGAMPKLGLEAGRFEACPDKPNCVSSQAQDEAHFIEPIVFNGTQAEAQAHLLKVLQAQANVKVTQTQADYIRSEFTSSLLRFVDDVEFYFPATESNTTLIQVRSASRLGYSDLGVNRKRVEKIRQQLKI